MSSVIKKHVVKYFEAVYESSGKKSLLVDKILV